MKRWLLTCAVLLLMSGVALAQAPRLAGLAPASGGPGSRVTVLGGPFDGSERILFGDRLLAPSRVEPARLTFTVPALPEGEYLLALQSMQGISAATLTFRLILPPPEILSLSPSQIDGCSGLEQRRVTVAGRGLQAGVQLLLNGAALDATRTGDSLLFNVPDLPAGLHQVQLRNPNGQMSLAVALLVDTTPEIRSVAVGAEFLNHYQLIISGRNFLFNSRLIADGRQVPAVPASSMQVDRLTYVDCNSLIYHRYPVSSQPRTVLLQVLNPDGRESAVFSATIP
jgi:hypothetical protein